MKKLNLSDSEKIIRLIKKGAIGVMPTDTIYGVVASATTPQSIGRLIWAKKRTPAKPLIFLVSSIKDSEKFFGLEFTKKERRFLNKVWPGEVTAGLEISESYRHKLGIKTSSIGIRVPNNNWLLNIIKKSGPIVAPSANPEGMTPAKNIREAENYFGDEVEFYVDGGEVKGNKPSTLITMQNDDLIILRVGMAPRKDLFKLWKTVEAD